MVVRPFEALVHEIARRLNIQASPRPGETKAGALVRRLDAQRELGGLGLEVGALRKLWEHRNEAVHTEAPITKRNADFLVKEVGRLLEAVGRWSGSRRA